MNASRLAAFFGVLFVIAACNAGAQDVAPPPTAPGIGECPTSGERQCSSTTDCGADFHCTGGRCFANQMGCPCAGASECGSSAHCAKGRCYANGPGVPCESTEECGTNAHCSGGGCYANTTGSPCAQTSECGPGSSCVSSTCN